MIPAACLANATKHNQASANKSCNSKPLRPTTHRTTTKHNQASAWHSCILWQFLATRVSLRNIKRQRRKAINFQLESLKPLRPTSTQPKHNQASAWRSYTFWHFMATRVRLRNIKRQRREAINLQLESLKPLRPTTQRAPNQNTIRLPHCVLALSGTFWPIGSA